MPLCPFQLIKYFCPSGNEFKYFSDGVLYSLWFLSDWEYKGDKDSS